MYLSKDRQTYSKPRESRKRWGRKFRFRPHDDTRHPLPTNRRSSSSEALNTTLFLRRSLPQKSFILPENFPTIVHDNALISSVAVATHVIPWVCQLLHRLTLTELNQDIIALERRSNAGVSAILSTLKGSRQPSNEVMSFQVHSASLCSPERSPGDTSGQSGNTEMWWSMHFCSLAEK